MTTIAYRAGVLAVDSRAIIDCIVPYHVQKMFRLSDGSIVAATGERQETLPFVEWLKGERTERPDLNETTVIQLTATGSLISHETKNSIPIPAEFMAWGSCSIGAIGAMYAGADAVRAVEIACLIDPSTGGPVVSMSIYDDAPTD